MVRPIMKDVFFLSRPSVPATAEDLPVADDLLETLVFHREGCVGMAANMIGVAKRIIAFDNGGQYMVMFNPVIVKKSGLYETEEGCLSLEGVRPTKRYQNIEVEYYDFAWKKQRMKLSGWTAQICQHEIDHLAGRIIQEQRTDKYLLERFQWSAENVVFDDKLDKVKEKLADVVNYCILMADVYGLDLDEFVSARIKRNNKKYPVERAYGSKETYCM